MEESFKKIIKKGTLKDRIRTYVFYIILGIVVIGNLTTINGENYDQNLSFMGMVLLIFGAFYWFNKSKFKPLKFWVDVFEKHPEKLIWIKPITTEHTAYFLVTYAKSYQFQIYLEDGTNIKIDCLDLSKETFYRMLKEYVPHAHLGYSKEVEKIYRRHRKRFLERLNEKGLLKTVNDYDL